MNAFIRIICISLIVILFLCSLLILFKAPTNFLWKVSVLATESGHYAAIITLSILILSHIYVFKNLYFNVLGILAICIFLQPVVQAVSISGNINHNLEKAFGPPELPFKALKLDFYRLYAGSSFKNYTFKELSYSTDSNVSLGVDLYMPKERKKSVPCVVAIHGGSWSSGNRKDLNDLNYYLAEHGIAVAAVSYRLSPKYIFPAQLNDIGAVIQWIRKNAIETGVDTSNIFLLGRSAGGQIAEVYGINEGRQKIKGIIAFYSPADLVWGYANPAHPWVHDSRKVLREYLGGDYKGNERIYKDATCLYGNVKNAPPILMIHGENDVMVAYGHNTRLQKVLNKYNIPNYLLSLPWATHGCDYFFNGPSGQLSAHAIEYFIRRYKSESE